MTVLDFILDRPIMTMAIVIAATPPIMAFLSILALAFKEPKL